MAPLGYRNVTCPDGKKRIEPDLVAAPIITKLFEWYATEKFSLREIGVKARAEGSNIEGTVIPFRLAPFVLFFANRCTTANLSGMVADAKVVMNPWFHANCGNEFKASWMAGE